MLKMYTYNYDAETDTSWTTFEFNLENLNGRQFITDAEVNEFSSDILATIYSDAYTVVGIEANWGDSIWFVVDEKYYANDPTFIDPDGPRD